MNRSVLTLTELATPYRRCGQAKSSSVRVRTERLFIAARRRASGGHIWYAKGIAKSVFLAAVGATSSTPSPPATWCRPSVLHCRRSRPEDDVRIVFSVQWSGVTYAGLVYVGLWRSAESPITRPILGYRSRSTKGERAGRLHHHRGATGPAPRQHGRRWCPLTPQPRRKAAVPLFIASCRSLHVPFGELPHRTHTIYTPTNTPPRGRWRPLSSRACSIGPMGGTGPRNTPHHALLAAFRLDLRSPDFSLMRRRPREVVQKSDFWGAP